MCIGVRPEGLDLWKFRNISYDEADDISFLSIEIISQISDGWTFRTIPLTTRLPVAGETVTIVGFRFAAELEFDETGLTSPAGGDLYAASGEVLAVHYPYRDSVMVHYPAIEIACGSLGAMSGGAIFDQDGFMLGTISTGVTSDEGDGPTYASWIVQGLSRPLTIPWPPGLYPQPVAMAAIPEGLLILEGREHVQLNGTMAEYRIWTK